MSWGPRTAEEAIIYGVGGGPVWQVYGWHWRREAPYPVRHIFGSWCRRSLIPIGFSPHPMPCNTHEPTGPARWTFLDWASSTFGDGELRGRGELLEDNSSSVGRSMSSDVAASLPLPDEKEEMWGGGGGGGRGRLSQWLGPDGFQLGSQALVFFLQLVRLYAQFDHLPGLLLLSCLQFLVPEEELVFRS